MLPTEEFLIIGIQDEKNITGKVKLEELRSLICEHIQVDPYYPHLLDALNEIGVSFADNKKCDVQTVFKALSNANFLRAIPNFINHRITKYNIKAIRAGLVAYTEGYLTMKQIGDAVSVHQMKEFENLSIGIPCTEETVMSTLWIVKRTMPTTVLNKWIDIHEDCLEVRNTLMVHEYIYLLCNTKDRTEMYEKIPKLQMNSRMDKQLQLFQVDQEFHKTYKSPDYKMQTMLNSWYNVDKANYDGISKTNIKPERIVSKNKKPQPIKMEDPQADEDAMFKKQLRSLLVTVEIKNRIRNANLKIAKMKLNGKMAYDEMTTHNPPHLTNSLPAPFGSKREEDMQSPHMKRVVTKENKQIPSRPQTGLKISTEISPQTILNANVRPSSAKAPTMVRIQTANSNKSHTRVPTAQSRLLTAQSRMPTTPSVMGTEGRKSVMNINLQPKRLESSFYNRIGTPSSIQLGSNRKYLENTYYTSNYSSKDTLTTFEDVFDQEYFAFEEAQKPKKPVKQMIFISDDLRAKKSRLFSA